MICWSYCEYVHVMTGIAELAVSSSEMQGSLECEWDETTEKSLELIITNFLLQMFKFRVFPIF